MLSKLKWVPFGDVIGTEPDRDDVQSAMGHEDEVASLQLRFVKFSLRQIYMACGWNDKIEDLHAAKRNFDDDLFEHKKQEWMRHMQKVLDQTYEEQWEWSRIRTELDLERSGQVALLDYCLPEGQQMRHLRF